MLSNMSAIKTAQISTVLSARVKEALSKFCRQRGLKISRFIEEAIIERLEDEADIAVYEARKSEDRISIEDLIKSLS